jgi:hypothetical protein
MLADEVYSSELEKDLAQRANDKAHQLCMDMLSLFDTAEINTAKASFHICEALLDNAAKLMAAFTKIPPEKAGMLFEKLVAVYQRDAALYVAKRKAEAKKAN